MHMKVHREKSSMIGSCRRNLDDSRSATEAGYREIAWSDPLENGGYRLVQALSAMTISVRLWREIRISL